MQLLLNAVNDLLPCPEDVENQALDMDKDEIPVRLATDPAAPDPPTPEERAALLGHPGVRNLLAAFPDAHIVGFTTPAAPTQPELFAEPVEEPA